MRKRATPRPHSIVSLDANGIINSRIGFENDLLDSPTKSENRKRSSASGNYPAPMSLSASSISANRNSETVGKEGALSLKRLSIDLTAAVDQRLRRNLAGKVDPGLSNKAIA
jgi:hypothetical protein